MQKVAPHPLAVIKEGSDAAAVRCVCSPLRLPS
jgi:hypothetical protein